MFNKVIVFGRMVGADGFKVKFPIASTLQLSASCPMRMSGESTWATAIWRLVSEPKSRTEFLQGKNKA